MMPLFNLRAEVCPLFGDQLREHSFRSPFNRCIATIALASLSACATPANSNSNTQHVECLVTNLAAVQMLEESIERFSQLRARRGLNGGQRILIDQEIQDLYFTIQDLTSIRQRLRTGNTIREVEVYGIYAGSAEASAAIAEAEELKASDMVTEAKSCAAALT